MLSETKERNLLPLPETEPRLLGRPFRSLVTIPTELSRLGQYIGLSTIIISLFKMNACPKILPFISSLTRMEDAKKE
jgi:hypothetical protein